MIKVGIIGSGFICKGFFKFSNEIEDISVSHILTRSIIANRTDIPNPILTNDIEVLISSSDIIIECSGDTIHATNCINEILKYDIPVITMNSEFNITCGNHFYDKGILFEAEGDQSGCIFKLDQEITDMGFNPLVYGNYKKYLNLNPSKKQASYWAKKNNISIDKTIAFTDGSKMQIENVFIANSLDAYIHDEIEGDYKYKLDTLIQESIKTGRKFVDYFLYKKAPSGIFIATNHSEDQDEYLRYLGFNTNYQIIERPYHFCHLEIYKSIKNIIYGRIQHQMRNIINRYMVASLSKRDIKRGTLIKKGLGSIDFRGIPYKYNSSIVPITLLENAVIKHNIPRDHILTFNDIEYNDNLATNIWRANE